MYTHRSIARRFGAIAVSLAAGALVLFTLAGTGNATSDPATDASCESTCIDAGGAFGPTVPVSLDTESADQFIAIIEGDSGQDRAVSMDFMSVEEGTEIVVLATGDRVATVQFTTGRVGYVPVAWVNGA